MRRIALTIGVMVALVLAGCHQAQQPPSPGTGAPAASAPTASDPAANDAAAERHEAAADSDKPGVTLTPEEVRALGIETTQVQAVDSTPEVSGFAVVLPHESIAQALAELRTAEAAERQSRSALERARRLTGTPGAMPADTQETAKRQATADQAALELARQRLTATFGQNPPWERTGSKTSVLKDLASGRAKLVRATFPLGAMGVNGPQRVYLAPLDSHEGDQRWQSGPAWSAPADATLPGRSYFTILTNADIGEGDHLLAWVPVGQPEQGVSIPAAAAVIDNGKFFYYVEDTPGTFVRTEFDPDRPVAQGYFVKAGISPGDKVVTTAAGLLLARETNPSKEPD